MVFGSKEKFISVPEYNCPTLAVAVAEIEDMNGFIAFLLKPSFLLMLKLRPIIMPGTVQSQVFYKHYLHLILILNMDHCGIWLSRWLPVNLPFWSSRPHVASPALNRDDCCCINDGVWFLGHKGHDCQPIYLVKYVRGVWAICSWVTYSLLAEGVE